MSRTVEIPDFYDNISLEECAATLKAGGWDSLASNVLKAKTIEEPMGLGAVVRDREGVLWQRIDADPAWFNKTKWDQTWDQLHVAEILSQGWQG